VSVDFGARSNAELIVARGEAVAGNAHDCVKFHVEASSLPQDGARRVREEVLQRRYGLQIGDQMKLLADRVPVETVEALAVMAASPKQLRKLAKVPTGTPLRLPSALEMLALENLVHACQTI